MEPPGEDFDPQEQSKSILKPNMLKCSKHCVLRVQMALGRIQNEQKSVLEGPKSTPGESKTNPDHAWSIRKGPRSIRKGPRHDLEGPGRESAGRKSDKVTSKIY